MSLSPIAPALGEHLATEVGFASDCVGSAAKDAIERVDDGGFCLLENLRFHQGEEANDAEFTAALASHGEIYVDDAFGCCHRAHASIVGVPQRARVAAAGRLVQKEKEAFDKLLTSEQRPFVAILGGAKIRGKIDAIESLLEKVDTLLIGGSMANTFLAAQGHNLGASKIAEEELDLARSILETANATEVEIRLPADLVVTDRLDANGSRRIDTAAPDAVATDGMAVDVGQKTVASYVATLLTARLIFWNGPMGVFEVEPFDSGSRALAMALAQSRGFSVVGGGETVAAVNLAGVADSLGHVSTGGGASLALVAGQSLPGLQVLEEAP